MKTFAGIVPASKFCLVGRALFGARALQKTPGEKARIQQIWLEIVDDGEDNDHEEDKNEDGDEFEDIRWGWWTMIMIIDDEDDKGWGW